MRIKSILLLVLCICLSTFFYCLLVGDPKPTINTIHKQFNHFKGVVINNNYNYNNIYINNNFNNNNKNDINSEESERNCDKYLRILGFNRNKTRTEQTRTLTADSLATNWPVFVTAVDSDQLDLAKGFVRSFQDNIYSNYSLIIYDLGLNRRQLLSISSICNESQIQSTANISRTEPTFELIPNKSSGQQSPAVGQTLCTIRRFDYQLFPSHVSDLKLFAFRPLILQLVLTELGSALWLDPNYYLNPSAAPKVQRLAERAKQEGILSWTIEQPTSSLTHPRMFEYFKTNQNQYYFHRMIRASHLLLYNTERIHNDLMLPWIKCALTHECLAPIGSQSYGCRFDKKPLYRYSGCHNYDTSALNVILGQMFEFDEKPYSAPEEDKFFRMVAIDDNLYTDSDITSDSDYMSNSYNIRGRPVSYSSPNNRTNSYSSSAKNVN